MSPEGQGAGPDYGPQEAGKLPEVSGQRSEVGPVGLLSSCLSDIGHLTSDICLIAVFKPDIFGGQFVCVELVKSTIQVVKRKV